MSILIYTDNGQHTQAYTTLPLAVASSSVKKIIITGSITLAADLTIPATIALCIENDGSIDHGAHAFSILGPFSAPRKLCLIGTGNLSLGQNTDIYPEWVGVVPDTGADLAAGMTQLNKLLVGKRGGDVVFSPGIYKSSVGYWINGYGIVTRGVGRVIIEPTDAATNYILMAGNREGGSHSTSMRLTASMLKGATSAAITDSTGYEAGNVVFVCSGKSSNSTVNNRIPLYKQFFTISSIVGNTLNFTSRAEFDFLLDADDTVTAFMLLPTATPAVGCRVENIEFRNNSTFAGAYLHGIFYAYMFEMVNCKLNAHSAVGYAAFSDLVTYRNCALVGYNGFSCASGTKRVTIDTCTYNEGVLTQDYSGFFEESPERLVIYNTDLYARVSVGSSADSAPSKQFIMRDCRVHAAGIALKVTGFYNSEGYAVDIDRTVFDAPGALNLASAGVRKSVIDIRFVDGYRITNCEFKNADADSYAIDVGNVGGITVNLTGNRYGTSLGPYSGADDNTSAIYKTGTFTPDLTFGGANTDITYSKQRGTYTRFGNRVFYTVEIVLSSKGTATGVATVGGLPYTSKNYTDTSYLHPASCVFGTTAATLTQFIQCYVNPNATTINIASLNAGVFTQVTNASFGNTTFFNLSGQYEI